MSSYDKAPLLLERLLVGTMAEAARAVGISPSLPYKWMVQSKLGHPELQALEFCGVVAPFHQHVQNAKSLMALQVEQTAFERARDGVAVDVFFQGKRQFEEVLKPEYAGQSDDYLLFEHGPDYRSICYQRVPTKQWLKPSDALVLKMLEAWNRKRYGAHQQIDVSYGGVLRLEKDAAPAVIEQQNGDVFEEPPDDKTEQRGGHLALAAPAKSSDEFEQRAAAGEFETAPVTFRKADGTTGGLRPDIEALRKQAEELRRNGPKHRQPQQPVPVGKPDDERVPDPQPAPSIKDNPRAYHVDKLSPPRQPPAYTGDERAIGTGREGVGVGPDPNKLGPHQGFRVSR